MNACTTICLQQENGSATTIGIEKGGVPWLRGLWGMVCGVEGNPGGHSEARGLLALTVNGKRCAAADFAVERLDHSATSLKLVLALRDTHLLIMSRWSVHSATGVLCRQDTLVNTGTVALHIDSAAARFAFTPGSYLAHWQESQWGNEHVLQRQVLGGETVELACRGGRTNEGCAPYLCLTETESQTAIAFHLVPQGNWRIRVAASTTVGQLMPQRVVELGPAAEALCYELAPGEAWALPEILIQSLPDGCPESGAPLLHRYLNETGGGNWRRRRRPAATSSSWMPALVRAGRGGLVPPCRRLARAHPRNLRRPDGGIRRRGAGRRARLRAVDGT